MENLKTFVFLNWAKFWAWKNINSKNEPTANQLKAHHSFLSVDILMYKVLPVDQMENGPILFLNVWLPV